MGFGSGNGETSIVIDPETRAHVGRGHVGSKRGEGTEVKRAGLRDRVGCYTWTWFTMTMATGGIANVLHSSNKS
jgi:hypothetical protein